MRNIKLTIEYDGTAYCGWQIQPNGVTVQAVLKRAIEKMVGHDVVLTGASRTDAGVHALGQVANFKTAKKIPCDGFLKGLNSLLPEDIVVKGAADVPDDFHAKRSAIGKHYRYLAAFGGARPALFRDRVWYVGAQYVVPVFRPDRIEPDLKVGTTTLAGKKGRDHEELARPKGWDHENIAKNINKAARSLVGTHDFSAFCGSGDSNGSKVREIYSIKAHVIPSACLPARQASEGFRARSCHPRERLMSFPRKRESSAFERAISPLAHDDMMILAIDIKGNGFLKYMVRNIVGTLFNFKPDPKIYKILEGRDRRKAGVTAPACGLYLVEVFY